MDTQCDSLINLKLIITNSLDIQKECNFKIWYGSNYLKFIENIITNHQFKNRYTMKIYLRNNLIYYTYFVS